MADSQSTAPLACRHCGKAIDGQRRKYCSRSCQMNQREAERRAATPKLPTRRCEQCGAEYKPADQRQRFCRPRCQQINCYQRGSPKVCKCKWCDKEYRPKYAERATFCSRDCAFAMRKEIKASLEREWEGHAPPENRRRPTPGDCLRCSKPFSGPVGKRFCSSECCYSATVEQKKDADRQRRGYRHCVVCGWQFLLSDASGTKVCSEGCAAEKRKIDNRTHKRRRRANLRKVRCGDYQPIQVFIRDRWVCYLCLNPVERKARVPHPSAATVDHVRPISKGGSDTLANVRCACFRCNTLKSDKMTEGDSCVT